MQSLFPRPPFSAAAAVMAVVSTSFALAAQSGFAAPEVTVGRNLQVSTRILLTTSAPPEGFDLTVTSEDPERVLLATAPDQSGSPSIRLRVKSRALAGPEFWIQGLSDRGVVKYTISSPGSELVKGAVILKPSAIVIDGPFHLPRFTATPHGTPAELRIVSARLDDSLRLAEEQQIAGGLNVDVSIMNSNPEAGVLTASKLTLAGGSSVAVTYFKPAAEASAEIKPYQPQNFTAPAEFASIIASVERPSLAITSDLTIGKDLQMPGVLCLGEAPPEGGLQVTLTSSDPTKLVLSAREDQPGSGTLTLTVPPGQLTAPYFIQALGNAGTVTYHATASGFRRRDAKIDLAPSAIVLAYDRDIRQVNLAEGNQWFHASLADAKEKPFHVVVYAAYLDAASGIPVESEPLRAGVSAKVVLHSSNAAAAIVESPLTIGFGVNRVLSRFTPAGLGDTTISLTTPRGFSIPKSGTSARATVVP